MVGWWDTRGGWAAEIMDPHNKFVRRMAPWRSRAWLASTDTSLEVEFCQTLKPGSFKTVGCGCWMFEGDGRCEVSSPSPLVVVCLFKSFIHLNRIINSRFVSFSVHVTFLMALKRHRHRNLIGLA